MAAGLVLLFSHVVGEDQSSAKLLAASVFDADSCRTVFPSDVDPDMREGWDQNVAGKWDHANDKTPGNVGELIRYNMLLPTAYEEFDTLDAASQRADALVTADPPTNAQTYVATRTQNQPTAGGTE